MRNLNGLNERKVFGIGLSRTGTTSLATALNLLGLRACHWPHDRVTQQELIDYHNGQSCFRLSVAEQYDAVTDTPVASVFRELSEVYPDSRFVLTIRDKESWLRSCEHFFGVGAPSRHSDSWYDRYCAVIRETLYGQTRYDRAVFSDAYDRHLSNVLEWFAPVQSRLLVLDIIAGEGWAQLSNFLGQHVPAVPFPHDNPRLAN